MTKTLSSLLIVSLLLPLGIKAQDLDTSVLGDDPFSRASFFKPLFRTYKNQCGVDPLKTHGPAGALNRLEGICQAVMEGPVCKDVEEGSRLQCDRGLDVAHRGSLWNFFAGCVGGLWDSGMDLLRIMGTILKWAINPIGSVSATTEYMGSVMSYLNAEYERAYQESSWPLRQVKAAKKMGGTLLRTLFNTITQAISLEIHQYGCLNYRARRGLICQIVGNIFLPGQALKIIRPILMTGGRNLGPLIRRSVDKGRDFLKAPQMLREEAQAATRAAQRAAQAAEEARDVARQVKGSVEKVERAVDEVKQVPKEFGRVVKGYWSDPLDGPKGRPSPGASQGTPPPLTLKSSGRGQRARSTGEDPVVAQGNAYSEWDFSPKGRNPVAPQGSASSSRAARASEGVPMAGGGSASSPSAARASGTPHAPRGEAAPPGGGGLLARFRARGRAFVEGKKAQTRQWAVERASGMASQLSPRARRTGDFLQRNIPLVSATGHSTRAVVSRVRADGTPQEEGTLIFLSGEGVQGNPDARLNLEGRSILFQWENQLLEGKVISQRGREIRVSYRDRHGFEREVILRSLETPISRTPQSLSPPEGFSPGGGRPVSLRNWHDGGGLSRGVILEEGLEKARVLVANRDGVAREILVSKSELYAPLRPSVSHINLGDDISFFRFFWQKTAGKVVGIRGEKIWVEFVDFLHQRRRVWVRASHVEKIPKKS